MKNSEKNQYGNATGFHTPDMSHEFRKAIETATGGSFACYSWHNDTVDTITSIGLGVTVQLPNIPLENTPMDCEESNFFYLVKCDENGDGFWDDATLENCQCMTIEEVVEKIKTIAQ